MSEFFDLIDSVGKVIGTEERAVVHAKGLLHRAVDVFVLDKQGRVFIQQRSFKKDIGPGLWGISVAEHLKVGETFKEVAARGVKEELGIKSIELRNIDERKHHLEQGMIRDNEKVEVFECSFEGKIRLGRKEVEQGKWVTKEELLRDMKESPEKFTPWLLQDKKFVEGL